MTRIAFFLLLLCAACNTTPGADPVSGAWTSYFQNNSALPPDYRDTLRFFGKDSFSIRIYTGGKLQQDTRGTYRYDAKKRTLSTVSPRGPINFSVLVLQRDTLRMRDAGGTEAVFLRADMPRK
ncbi:MAG: hypothetical protein EOO12_09905 [Chitinophagaceae bacterium]|nr:MAG: hypothetical protein EOO12_09905 [Chitinophagaceae bacterium]